MDIEIIQIIFRNCIKFLRLQSKVEIYMNEIIQIQNFFISLPKTTCP